MRNPLITAFLALFITPLQAGDLCDAACKITIDFPDDGTDVGAIANGYVSVTPIGLDLTNQHFLEELHRWNLQVGAE